MSTTVVHAKVISVFLICKLRAKKFISRPIHPLQRSEHSSQVYLGFAGTEGRRYLFSLHLTARLRIARFAVPPATFCFVPYQTHTFIRHSGGKRLTGLLNPCRLLEKQKILSGTVHETEIEMLFKGFKNIWKILKHWKFMSTSSGCSYRH